MKTDHKEYRHTIFHTHDTLDEVPPTRTHSAHTLVILLSIYILLPPILYINTSEDGARTRHYRMVSYPTQGAKITCEKLWNRLSAAPPLPFQPAHLSPAPWQRIEAGKDDIDEEPLPARAAASLSQQPALEQPTHLTTASTSPYSPPQRPAAPAAHQPMMQPQPQQFALDILSTPASQAAASSSGALLGLSRRPRATAAPMPPPLLTRCVPPTRRRQ